MTCDRLDRLGSLMSQATVMAESSTAEMRNPLLGYHVLASFLVYDKAGIRPMIAMMGSV